MLLFSPLPHGLVDMFGGKKTSHGKPLRVDFWGTGQRVSQPREAACFLVASLYSLQSPSLVHACLSVGVLGTFTVMGGAASERQSDALSLRVVDIRRCSWKIIFSPITAVVFKNDRANVDLCLGWITDIFSWCV